MELKKIKGYILGFSIGISLGITALTYGGAFDSFTGMTQTWFDAIKTKLNGTYTSGKMCTSDATGQIQCITDIPAGGAGFSLPQNSQTFLASTTFTVPAGVTRILVYGCGGGGGGGGNTYDEYGGIARYGGGGGGSMGIPKILTVTRGSSIAVTIGAGGRGGTKGGNGGTSSFGSILFRGGGGGGVRTGYPLSSGAGGKGILGLDGNGKYGGRGSSQDFVGSSGGAGMYGAGAAAGVAAGANTCAGGGSEKAGGSGRIVIYR